MMMDRESDWGYFAEQFMSIFIADKLEGKESEKR